jgi:hypothetical protein
MIDRALSGMLPLSSIPMIEAISEKNILGIEEPTVGS